MAGVDRPTASLRLLLGSLRASRAGSRSCRTFGQRSPGRRILVSGLAIAAMGTAPLFLYVLFGLADGKPITLGLLAMPVGIVGGRIGAVTLGLEYRHRRPS